MKHLTSLILCLMIISFFTFESKGQQRTCQTMDLYYESMQVPEIAQKRQDFLNKINTLEQNSIKKKKSKTYKNSGQENNFERFEVDGNIYRIPTVFHIVHNGDAIGSNENISDAQVLAQMEQLNDDFRRMNSDAGNTLPVFQPVAADTEIEFCLASLDPSGAPSTGILRHSESAASYSSVNLPPVQAVHAWPSADYLNIWVCNLTGGLLGYAYLPGTAPNADVDGVVCLYSSIGSIASPFPGGAPYDKGRTTTHEVGHWLNLEHVWGSGGCGVDDGVADTPNQEFPNYGCDLTSTNCGSLNMAQNYMDYSDDACMNIFTAGQSTRMRNAILNGRSGLLTSSCGNTPCTVSAPVILNNSPLSFCFSPTYTLVANTAPSGFNHQWTENGNDIIGEVNQLLTVNTAGTYGVYLTDGNNCESPFSNAIVVSDCGTGISCTPVINLSGSNTPGGIYEAQLNLTSIIPNQSNTTVVFYAGDYVLLESGFANQASTDFLAAIQSCNPPTGPLLDEDFSGCGLPAGWSFNGIPGTGAAGISTVGFGDTETASNYYTYLDPASFSGCIAEIDDDAPGSGDNMTTCIETAAVDIGSISNATLSFNWSFAEYTGGSQALFDVWNGSNWINIYTVVSNTSSALDLTGTGLGADCSGSLSSAGPAGDPDVFDISCYNNSDFKVRFCYDDLGDWGWEMGIDNVLIE